MSAFEEGIAGPNHALASLDPANALQVIGLYLLFVG